MIYNILNKLEEASGRIEKERILKTYDSHLLRKILDYTYNPYKQYFVIKLPEFASSDAELNNEVWDSFFDVLDMLDKRTVTGNDAIGMVANCISQSGKHSKWMRKVLERHLNVGITERTINKVFNGLIDTFEVQLAHKFQEKRIKGKDFIATEPKLDGIRCLAICKGGNVTLFTRNGKVINNYDETIVLDLQRMAKSGNIPDNAVFDGELMGPDFKSTVSQFRRKTNADVSNHNLYLFDWLPFSDWENQSPTKTTQEMREDLEDFKIELNSNFIKLVHRDIVSPDQIDAMHDVYTTDGFQPEGLEPFEGVMIKLLDEPYKFGRGYNVMKYKSFVDVDLEVVGFKEGEKKYTNSLGAVVVKVNSWNKYPDGILVGVGSGFSDEDREHIWNNRSNFRGMIAEIRYQACKDNDAGPNGETPDGSLRFPTFRGWRTDKKK